MTCHDARELFSAISDGALTTPERAEVDTHLAGCAECRRELERFQGTVALLRAVEPVRAPAGFVDRVLAVARPAPWYRRLLRAAFVPWATKLPAEAAAVVLVGVAVALVFRATPELQHGARVAAPPAATQTTPRATAASRAVTRPPATPTPERETAPAPASRRGQRETPAAGGAGQIAELDAARQSRPAPAPSEPREAPAAKLKDAVEADRARSLGAARSAPVSGAPAGQKAWAPAAPFALAPAPADLAGRLSVDDRGAAERALAELVARAGGREVARHPDPDGALIEVEIPRAAFPEFARGLAALGRWQPGREPAELPALVRVQVELGG